MSNRKPKSAIHFIEGKVAKQCSVCKETKIVLEFGFALHGFLGRTSVCNSCKNEQHKLYRINNPEKIRDNQLRYERGIGNKEYYEMYEKQNGKCIICQEDFKVLDIDHDHKTDKIRELLCRKCNLGLGYFKDNPLILQNALNYLIKHQIEKV